MDENPNPYAAPLSNPEREPVRSEALIAGKGTFSIGECLRDGWNNTVRNLGPVLAVELLGGVLFILSYVTCIGVFLVLPVLYWGIAQFLLNTHDQRCDFADLFAGFLDYGAVLRQSLVLMILMFLLGLIGSVFQFVGSSQSEEWAAVGMLASLAWSLLVMIRLYWSWFFLPDQGLRADESLRASWRATGSSWLKLIGLALLSLGIVMLGFLALGVGVLIALPVVFLMFTSAYRQTVGAPAPPSLEFE